MAAGTLRPNILDLPGKSLKGIRHGLDFLLEANSTDYAEVGKHVYRDWRRLYRNGLCPYRPPVGR